MENITASNIKKNWMILHMLCFPPGNKYWLSKIATKHIMGEINKMKNTSIRLGEMVK